MSGTRLLSGWQASPACVIWRDPARRCGLCAEACSPDPRHRQSSPAAGASIGHQPSKRIRRSIIPRAGVLTIGHRRKHLKRRQIHVLGQNKLNSRPHRPWPATPYPRSVSSPRDHSIFSTQRRKTPRFKRIAQGPNSANNAASASRSATSQEDHATWAPPSRNWGHDFCPVGLLTASADQNGGHPQRSRRTKWWHANRPCGPQ